MHGDRPPSHSAHLVLLACCTITMDRLLSRLLVYCCVCVCVCLASSAELEKCYNFTVLAVQLNETEDGVPPSDSRLRPDQRLMELGQWDDANTCKVLLEEKQRSARRQRERQMEDAATHGRLCHMAGLMPCPWFLLTQLNT